MNKVVRIVWISALTGLAFLSACLTQNGLTRKQRKQLIKERQQVEMELANFGMGDIHLYGNIEKYLGDCNKKYSLENKLDSINYRLGDSIDLDHNSRRRQILQRIDSLNYLIENYSPPCIYGSPEMLEEYKYKVDEKLAGYQKALDAAQQELDEIDGKKKQVDQSQQKKEAQRKRDSIRQARRGVEKGLIYGPPPTSNKDRERNAEIIRRYDQLQSEFDSIYSLIRYRDSISVIGSPEEIEEYRQETDSMRLEVQRIHKELFRLKNERKARNI